LSLTDRVVDLRRQFGTLLIIIATPQKTRKRERENLRSKIKRKKKTRVSLSLFSSRARAHPSDFHWLIAIDFDSSSSSSSLLHTQKVAFVGNHRQHSGCKNERAPLRETKREREREREKNEIQKKYTRERENTAHTDCFIISAIGSARATSRALVQRTTVFCNHRVSQCSKMYFFTHHHQRAFQSELSLSRNTRFGSEP